MRKRASRLCELSDHRTGASVVHLDAASGHDTCPALYWSEVNVLFMLVLFDAARLATHSPVRGSDQGGSGQGAFDARKPHTLSVVLFVVMLDC